MCLGIHAAGIGAAMIAGDIALAISQSQGVALHIDEREGIVCGLLIEHHASYLSPALYQDELAVPSMPLSILWHLRIFHWAIILHIAVGHHEAH